MINIYTFGGISSNQVVLRIYINVQILAFHELERKSEL